MIIDAFAVEQADFGPFGVLSCPGAFFEFGHGELLPVRIPFLLGAVEFTVFDVPLDARLAVLVVVFGDASEGTIIGGINEGRAVEVQFAERDFFVRIITPGEQGDEHGKDDEGKCDGWFHSGWMNISGVLKKRKVQGGLSDSIFHERVDLKLETRS